MLPMATAALFVSLAAGCGAETSREAAPARPSSAPPAVCHDPLNDEDGHCALELKDSHSRTAAPAIGQDEALDEAALDVFHSARDAGCLQDERDSNGHCAGPVELAATEQYVTLVRRSLVEAGYTGAQVRLGREEDPTAVGALIWAVRVGDVCVFGDVTPPPAERVHEWYAGLLPDGRCLTAP